MIKKIVLPIIIFLAILNCTNDIDNENNNAPEFVKVLTNIFVEKNSSRAITFNEIEAYDKDGDALTIVVHNTDNCTVSGTTVTPDSGYIGNLYLGVQVSDGLFLSEMDTIILSVVEKVELMPLFTGAWWKYNDSLPITNELSTSRMEAGDSITRAVDSLGTKKSIYDVRWSNLSEYGIVYCMNNDDSGTVLYGGYSPSDTICLNQRLNKFPAKLDASWAYTSLKYNATDSLFFVPNDSITITCTDTAKYITVPAGLFRCSELSYSYTVAASSRSRSIIDPFCGKVITFLGKTRASRATVITEKLYYSEGVGLVQNITTQDNVTIWKKVLTDYSVIERVN